MTRRFGIAVVLTGLILACAAPGPTVDLEAERASLMEADRAWSETVGDAQAFAAVFEPQGKLMPPEDPLLIGPEAIRNMATQMFAVEGFSLTWQADSAEVSGDASLGYTTGSFQIEVPAGPDSGAVKRTGDYTTVWRKQQDGSWKVAVDCVSYDTTAPAGE